MGTTYAVTTTSGGYRVILAVPWSGIGVTPSAGLVLGADVALNDLDGTQLASGDWAGVTPFAQPIRWNGVQLAAASGGQPGVGGGGSVDGPAAGGGGEGHHGCDVDAGSGATETVPMLFFVLPLFALSRRIRR